MMCERACVHVPQLKLKFKAFVVVVAFGINIQCFVFGRLRQKNKKTFARMYLLFLTSE